MGLDEKTEKRHASGRYVKSNLGLWSGREILPWYLRLVFAPLYAMQIFYYCLRDVPVNLQILHGKHYVPGETGMLKCPQCKEPIHRNINLDFEIGGNDESKE